MNSLIAVLAILLIAAVCAAAVSGGTTASSSYRGAPTLRSAPASIWVPLVHEDGALRAEASVAGKPVSLIVDTGSPYLIVPKSLPCARCSPTGTRSVVSYGDGTEDNAVFTRSSDGVAFAGTGATFRNIVFGGSHLDGRGPGGNDAVLGLAPVKPPCDPVDPACVARYGAARVLDPTVGPSFSEQTGVRVVEFDLTRPGRLAMRLGGASMPVDPTLRLEVEARLVPRGQLWTNGVDHAADFYVARLDPAKNAGLEFLIIDSGTTLTLLPDQPPGDVALRFERGEINVRGADIDEIPDIYGDSLHKKVGILGNRSMLGKYVVIDSIAGVFRLYGV